MVKNRIRGLVRKIVFGNVASSWTVYENYLKVHPTAIINPMAQLNITMKPNLQRIYLEIDEYSNVFSTFNFLRPEATITIGKRCQLGASNFISAESIVVEDDVLMAWGVTVFDNDAHSVDCIERQKDITIVYNQHLMNNDEILGTKNWDVVAKKKILIKSNAWIGFNSTILKGVEIGENAVVGACSVVTRSVPSNAIVAGNPAKIIRMR